MSQRYRRAIRSVGGPSRRRRPPLQHYTHRFSEGPGRAGRSPKAIRTSRGADLSHMTGLSGMDLHGLGPATAPTCDMPTWSITDLRARTLAQCSAARRPL